MYYFIFYLRVICHQTVLTNIYSVLKAKEVCYFLFRAFTKPHPSLQLQIRFSFFRKLERGGQYMIQSLILHTQSGL